MMKNNYFFILVLFWLSGCSTVPPAPISQTPPEDIPEVEQTEEREQVIVSTIPEDPIVQSQQDINEIDLIVNEAIVPVSPSRIEPVEQSSAVVALLDTAQQHQQNGDLHSAQSSLQRAQRIAPRDPEVYFSLANTHRELQDYGLAEQVALKGVSIVQGQPDQLRRFWNLIADIRQDAENFSGAKKARAIANRY